MTSAASMTELDQLFETHASQVGEMVRTLVAQARECGRREFADQLNQAVRRIRQAENVEQVGATLVDAVTAFAEVAAWFRVEGDTLRGGAIRVSGGETRDLDLEVKLESARAFGGAVESRDPVIAAATPTEIPERLAELAARSDASRVSVYPLVVRGQVPSLICAWGAAEDSAIELLTQVAAGVWAELSRPAALPLVQIAAVPEATPPPDKPEPEPRSAWDSLPPEEQRIHLRAQRFARVQVAEMRLHQADAVQSGRAQQDLYGALRKTIDSARESYRQDFFSRCASMVDYFHLELVRTLAHDDVELLGKDYPGPMV